MNRARTDAQFVRGEFARRVAASNPGRAIPARVRVDGAHRPVLLGAGIGLAIVAVGWFLPWEHFVDVALLAVGIGALMWRPVS